MTPRKVACDCGWRGRESQLVCCAVTRQDTGRKISDILVCPACLDADDIVYACDEPGCWSMATCGTKTKDGYRRTCGRHVPGDPPSSGGE